MSQNASEIHSERVDAQTGVGALGESGDLWSFCPGPGPADLFGRAPRPCEILSDRSADLPDGYRSALDQSSGNVSEELSRRTCFRGDSFSLVRGEAGDGVFDADSGRVTQGVWRFVNSVCLGTARLIGVVRQKSRNLRRDLRQSLELDFIPRCGCVPAGNEPD